MKIACIGNYPPRECGIATFTSDLIGSLPTVLSSDEEKVQSYVVAINDQDQNYNYPEIVKKTIKQNYLPDYIEAAKFINVSDAEVCILQHEFGIFGGNSGVYILPLIHRLKIPIIVIFHTVLKHPSYNEKNIIQEIAKRSSAIVVMNSIAIGFLEKVYRIENSKMHVIEHGVPEFDFSKNSYHKKKIKVEGRNTILTFGLLSRNKGIETVINALVPVVESHPDLLYIILGKTHPSVVRTSGEEYRNYLKQLVYKYNLTNNVFFDNRFVSRDDLLSYLCATDIYITPYLNEAQITSGTLAYAVVAGTAVISTPYWHAQELLSDDRGILFNFNDSEGLSEVLLSLLDDKEKLLKLRKRALLYGRSTTWPVIGHRYMKLIKQVSESYNRSDIVNGMNGMNVSLLPNFRLDHIKRMTDSTGILQHAKYNIPNFSDGYCLDDNARALLMTSMAYQQMKDTESQNIMHYYLSFIQYMQNEDGSFHNFMGFDRQFLDEYGSDDSYGRTLWALGYLVRYNPNDAILELANEMFMKALLNLDSIQSLRGLSNSIIGISHYLHRFGNDESLVNRLKSKTDQLLQAYNDTASGDWHWFEPQLTYDNGIIPYALLCSLEVNPDDEIRRVAFEAMAFLEMNIMKEGTVSLIGCNGWFRKGGPRSDFDQQPIDAMSLVLMYYMAYFVSKEEQYRHKMFSSFMWFLGRNDLCIPLYDFETKGCSDGLQVNGVNRNQGAESTLAYLISLMTVFHVYEIE